MNNTNRLLLPALALGALLAAMPLAISVDGTLSITSAWAQGRGGGGGDGDDERGRGRDDEERPGRGGDDERGRGADDNRGRGNDAGNRGAGGDAALNAQRGPKGERFLGNEPRTDGFTNHGDRVSTYVAIARALGLDANIGALQANFGTPQERGVTPVNGADNWEVANLDVNLDGIVNQLDLTAAQRQQPPRPPAR